MSNEVEEYSDEMKRESDLELKASMGKTQLAFVDLTTMSPTTRIICLVIAIVFFGLVGYIFYKQLFAKDPNPDKIRKDKIDAKRRSNPSNSKEKKLK